MFPALKFFRFVVWLPALLLSAGILLSAQNGDDEAAALVQKGRQALERGDFKTAVGAFKRVVTLEPGLYQARVNLGLAYHAMGDLPHAVDELAAARKRSTDLGGANLVLGSDYLALGKASLAIAPLEDAMKSGIGGLDTKAKLCEAFVKTERFSEASRCGTELYGAPPANATGWYQLGRQYLDSAQTLTLSVRHSFPNDRWTKRMNADVAAQNANWKLADRFYGEAAAITPTPPGFHAALGFTLLHLGKTQEAAREFSSEAAIAPGSVPAEVGMAEAALVSGDVQQASAKFSAVLQSNDEYLAGKAPELAGLLSVDVAANVLKLTSASTNAGERYIRALALKKTGKEQEAAPLLESLQIGSEAKPVSAVNGIQACNAERDRECIAALSKTAPTVAVIANLSAAYVRTGNFEKAAKLLEPANRGPERSYWLIRAYIGLSDDCFNALLTRYPSSALAYRLRAEYDQVRDNIQGAIENYQHAVKIDPQNAVLHAALASLLLSQNRVPEAATEAQAAIALQPDAPPLLVMAGKIDMAGGNMARAEARAKRAIALEPANLSAHELLGRILWKQQDAAGAAAELQQALPLDQQGDLHYLLYRAYQKQGKTALAQQALAQSRRLRQESLVDAQTKVAGGAPESERE